MPTSHDAIWLALAFLTACGPKSLHQEAPPNAPDAAVPVPPSPVFREARGAEADAASIACNADDPSSGAEMAAFLGDLDQFHALRSSRSDGGTTLRNCQPTALMTALSPYIAEPGTPERQEHERSKRKLRIADELLESCQDVNATDARGATALHVAVSAYYPMATVLSLTRRLIGCGATVDAPTKRGITPLMKAVLAERPEVVRLLLDAGANPQLRAEDGESAIGIAERTGQKNVVAVLRRGGRDGGR